MDLSIIIINYNSSSLLETCVRSIIASKPTLSYETIVIDNGSDSFPQLPIFNKAKIKLIINKKNVGFGRANNQGVEKAKGKHILLLNVDTEVIGNAIDDLYKFATSKKGIDIAGGKLLNPDKTDQPSAGPFYSLLVVFGMLFLKGDYWGLTRYSPSHTRKVDWISGACIMMKKSIYTKIRGFDEKIFLYMEEIDLLYRTKQKGFQVYYYPEAQFVHIGAATSRTRTKPILNIYQGLVYFYRKHHSDSAVGILKVLLYTKAYIGIIIGVLTNNHHLTTTYKKAVSYL